MSNDAGNERDVFRKDVGEWEGDLTITPGPGQAPQKSKGRLVGKLISGGKWLVLDFRNLTTGFEGHGIYGYDPGIKRYVGTWVDDMRNGIMVAEGDWDPATRAMTYVWKASMPDGQTMAWREISQFTSDDEQTFRVVMPTPDGKDFEMMSVQYRRVKG